MKKHLLFPVIIAAVLLSPLKCGAQVSLEFNKLGVNNINSWTNHKTSQKLLQEYGTMLLSGVSVEMTAKLINTGDEVIYFDEEAVGSRDNIKLAVYFYEMGSGWRKMYLYNPHTADFNVLGDIYSLAPGDTVTLCAGAVFPAWLFQKEPPLYYVSGIVPTMYLTFEMPGHAPFFSDLPKAVFLNGENLASYKRNCYYCGELYYMTYNTEVLEELMGGFDDDPTVINLMTIFGNSFYNLWPKAFVCNMDYTRRAVPIYSHP